MIEHATSYYFPKRFRDSLQRKTAFGMWITENHALCSLVYSAVAFWVVAGKRNSDVRVHSAEEIIVESVQICMSRINQL